VIGYSNGKEVLFFEGIIKGKIVKQKGESGFGWDPIFVPEGKTKTFAEMTIKEKNSISHRKKALEKFKKYYLENKKE
jgi:XTP/dITP diphosphohydrolase